MKFFILFFLEIFDKQCFDGHEAAQTDGTWAAQG